MSEILSFTLANCPPAKMIENIVEEMLPELSSDVNKDLKIIKVDAEDQRELSEKFLITAIPTLVVIKDDQEAGRLLGYYQRDELKTKLKTFITAG